MKDMVCKLDASHPCNCDSPPGVSDEAIVRHAIESGVNAFLQKWPGPVSATFRRYRTRFTGSSSADSILPDSELPYWLYQPAWLARHYSAGDISQREREFLRDVILGQYCVYLSVRIADDLFDRQSNSRALLHAAQLFRREARRIFLLHFSKRRAFWGIYRSCLATTSRHIRLVDRLQRSPWTDPNELLLAYAGVNAIFTIGAASVCLRHRRMRDYRMVQAFSGRCSAGTQVLDDMADVREDLRRHRWNYAANMASRSISTRNSGRRTRARRIEYLFHSAEVPATLVGQVKTMVESAFDLIRPLRMAGAERCRRKYRLGLSRMEETLRTLSDVTGAELREAGRTDNDG